MAIQIITEHREDGVSRHLNFGDEDLTNEQWEVWNNLSEQDAYDYAYAIATNQQLERWENQNG